MTPRKDSAGIEFQLSPLKPNSQARPSSPVFSFVYPVVGEGRKIFPVAERGHVRGSGGGAEAARRKNALAHSFSDGQDGVLRIG